jgi:hypothetical protein
MYQRRGEVEPVASVGPGRRVLRRSWWRRGRRGLVPGLVLAVVLGSCVVDDSSADDGPAPVETTEQGQADTEEPGSVEFSSWAEDSFEENAYSEVVDLFTTDTGIPVEMDLTVNEIPLEDLGR